MTKPVTRRLRHRTVSGVVQHPKLIFGGTQHQHSTSFKSKKLSDFERTKMFRDQGTVWVCPTRGTIPTPVVVSWFAMQWPQNHFRSPLMATERMEVGEAYELLVSLSLSRTELRKGYEQKYADAFADSPFILTCEEDNIIPPTAVPDLLAAIYTCPDCGREVFKDNDWRCERNHYGYSAVAGLYFIKTDPPIPMAFGTPGRHRSGTKLPNSAFAPRDVRAAIKSRSVIEVNGVAMGCTLWRKDLFRRVKRPWFKTTPYFTQDLWFCKRAKETVRNVRFGVHCGVRVAHLDVKTGAIY